MGILDSIGSILFGEKPEAQVHTQPTFTPEQQRIMKEILEPFIQGLNLDPSSLDPSAAAQTSLEGLEQRALALVAPPGGQTSSQGAVSDIFQRGVGFDPSGATESGLANFANPELFNELFKSGVTDPALKEFNEDILPNIARRFSPNTFFGSERIKSDDRALKGLTEFLGGERSRQFLDKGLTASVELERSRRGDLDRALQRAGLDTEAILQAVGFGGTEGVDLRSLASILESSEFARLGELDKLNVILGALGLTGQENIATVTGGTTGLVQAFLGSAGGSQGVSNAVFGPR